MTYTVHLPEQYRSIDDLIAYEDDFASYDLTDIIFDGEQEADAARAEWLGLNDDDVPF